jgi:hypothetical protein
MREVGYSDPGGRETYCESCSHEDCPSQRVLEDSLASHWHDSSARTYSARGTGMSPSPSPSAFFSSF